MLRKISAVLASLLKRLFGGNLPEDRDPYAGSLVRNRRGPNDRGSAAAVAEPDDD